jgi:PAS domain S-box-containing protein
MISTAKQVDAVLACLRGEKTYESVAHELGIPVESIQVWEQRFLQAGALALDAQQAEAHNHAVELMALNAVSQSLNAILDLDELLDAGTDALRVLFNYAPCVAMVEGTDVVVRAGYRPDLEPIPRGTLRLPLTASSILSFCALNGQLVHVPDTASEPRLLSDVGLGPIRSQLAIPLQFKGTVLGVLAIADARPNAFSRRDISILETVAAYLGVAIENAQLFNQVRQRIRQLELLQRVSAQAIEALDLYAVIRGAVQALRQIMSYPCAAVGLFEPSTGGLRLVMLRVLPDGEAQLTTEDALPEFAAQLKATISVGVQVFGDLTAQDAPLRLYDGSRSALVMPLRAHGELMGSLSVESEMPDAFGQSDIETLTILGDQLSVAIRSAELFQQTQAQLNEISVFRRLADEAIVGIITRDAEGNVDYANRAAARLFGFSDTAAMRGVPIRSLYPSDSGYAVDQQLYEMYVCGGHSDGWSGELEQMRLDGERIIVQASIFAVHTPEKHLLTCGMVLQDVTERRALTNMTEQANARFRAILEASTDGFIVWDDQQRIVMVSPAAARLLQTTPEALISRDCATLPQNARLEKILASPEGQRIDLPGEGHCIVRCASYAWQTDAASGRLMVIYDETARARLEDSREETIAMLIHDLRSPLTSVSGGIQMAQDVIADANDRGQAQHFLDLAQRGVQRMLSTANSLLDITKLEAGQLPLECEPVDIRTLLEDAHSMFAATTQATGITIRIETGNAPPSIGADSGLLRRALINLLDNALKFAPSGSEVELSAVRDGPDMLRFSVADAGPGVPEEYRRLIFEKYNQVPGQKGRRRGTGLGLALCRLVAEAHQGRIWIEPRPGGGSIFAFTIRDCADPRGTDG